MRAAQLPRGRVVRRRLLVMDPVADAFAERSFDELPQLLRAGDLVVVNDAATLPASLHTVDGAVEVRLLGRDEEGAFEALAFGAGDARMRTEARPPPPPIKEGTALRFRGGLLARVVTVASRGEGTSARAVVRLRFEGNEDALWPALYRAGRPIQYSYLSSALKLWDVQTVYAGRPWAPEAPSAGLPLRWEHLLALRARGIALAAVTHAAGISSTGDPSLDRALPLPERYEVPTETVDAVRQARSRGGRIVAVGTTVVRALEGCAQLHGGELVAGAGVTSMKLGPGFRPRIVNGVLTGVHERTESHYALLAAFTPASLLDGAHRLAEDRGFLTHEFGDGALILDGALDSANARHQASG